MIDVNVVVVGSPEKSTQGEVDPSMSLAAIKEDIIVSLNLDGEPSDWIIAVNSQDNRAVLKNYQPTNGDTLVLLPASSARGKAFRPKGQP